MASVETLDVREFRVADGDLDPNGFVSIWNIAAASSDGSVEATRSLAAKLLCFLCQKGCDFVVVSTTDAEYLDSWFERDNKLLFDWKPESEKVDVLSQHAEVPFEAFVGFVANQKFSSAVNYNPKRSMRVEWFTEKWSMG